MTSIEILTITISGLSLIVSVIVGYKMFALGLRQLKLANRLELQKMLLELNKEFLRDPSLCAYRDLYRSRLNIETITDEHRDRIETILHMLLNLLELVFIYFSPNKSMTKVDKREWEIWQNYFRNTLQDSSFLRTMLQDDAVMKEYDLDFINWARRQLTE